MATTTVLVNNYNNGLFIAACIDSLFAQTVKPDEIVVYDDGSTDESLAILRAYGDRIHLIEGLHDSNLSSRECQARALDVAFRRAKGEWLFLLDGDDYFLPQKIERVLAATEGRREVALVQSPVWLVNGAGEQFGRYRDSRFHCRDIRRAMYEQHDVDFYYPTSAMVVSRAAMEQVVPIDMRVCPELACDTRIGMLMPLLGEVVTVDEMLACWRRHSGSYLSGLARSRWFAAQQTIRRVRTFNSQAARYGVPKISLWRNRRFRRQLAGALLPETVRQRIRKTGTLFHGQAAGA
jgi:glycosyltransferase involved in cell wall biosynthesis